MKPSEFRQKVRRVTFVTYVHEEEVEEVQESLDMWWWDSHTPMYRKIITSEPITRRELTAQQVDHVWQAWDPETHREYYTPTEEATA